MVKRYLNDQVIKLSDSTKNIWGYNDGSNIYILREKFPGSESFYKMTFIGRYSILEEMILKISNYKISGVENVQNDYYAPAPVVKTDIRLLDHKTGNILKLTKENVLAIIGKDTELLKKYVNDKNRHIDLTTYIIAYNFKNPVSFPVNSVNSTAGKEVKW